jgi:hypothetical protein
MNFFDMNSEVCNLRAEDEPSLASFTCTCIPAGRPWSVWLRHRGEGFSRNQRINPMGGEYPTGLVVGALLWAKTSRA